MESSAIGYGNTVTGLYSAAIGHANNATGLESIAMGFYTTASNTNSSAMGEWSTASGIDSSAVGYGNTASAQDSSAFGDGNTIDDTADHSSAFGYGNKVSGEYALASGYDNTALATDSTALGQNSTASATDAIALGDTAAASAVGSIAIGANAAAGTANSVALGASSVTGTVHTDSTAQSITLNGTTYTFAGQASASAGTVSVGSAGNERQIQNVAAGDVSATSTDAINGSQLYAVAQSVNGDITNINNEINRLGSKVNHVGAGAAALSALHPLDFDPDDKWDFATGYGHYQNANAVSIGAFYRPNEDMMVSFGASLGNSDEKMYNAGLTFKLGMGNHISTSRVAMAKQIVEMNQRLNDLAKRNQSLDDLTHALLGILDTTKSADFPDVPANHWAYAYVSKLAGNGIIEGYPDGNFKGDRPMTRYEFAAMLYRAMQNGAAIDAKLLQEFKPELDRIRVDEVSTNVDRVRVIPGRG